jgi:flavin reductase (DIM6/NTAB) family NADH-FMN oxidoreductase RutF
MAHAVVEVRHYCDLMTAFPSGVAVVTALDAAGHPQGMTCTALASVTLHPPTLLVSLRHGSATLRAVTEGGTFAVNLLHHGARDVAALFAAPVPDRFARCAGGRPRSACPGWSTTPSAWPTAWWSAALTWATTGWCSEHRRMYRYMAIRRCYTVCGSLPPEASRSRSAGWTTADTTFPCLDVLCHCRYVSGCYAQVWEA